MMGRMVWLGVDIGGANLKVAAADEFVRHRYFPLWSQRERLASALAELLAGAPQADGLALTMTGELADCYPTKAAGVADILAAVTCAAPDRPIRVYSLDGRFLSVAAALQQPLEVAASNWVALANYARRHMTDEPSLMVDIGSTTSDILLADRQRILVEGRSDVERLCCGELVYTGVARSPLCALVDTLPWCGRECPVAQELFATTADVYVTLGDLAESDASHFTADGRALTRDLARDRLARTICCDRTMFSSEDARIAADAVRAAQVDQLDVAVRRVMGRLVHPPDHVIVSGSGEFLALRVIRRVLPTADVVSYTELLGQTASHVAPAYALSILANELLS